MRKQIFAVIGHPVGHTMSPFIHSRLFSLAGADAQYRALDIAPGDLSSGRAAETLRGLDGFNVTIPHKRSIIPLLDAVDEKAKLFSSVNTVKNENGKLTGYTTDGDGFLAALADAGVRPGGKSLVLGAGGVSHVMAFELSRASEEPDITVCARESGLEAAKSLCDSLSRDLKARGRTKFRLCACLYRELSPDDGFDLVANGTPCGMYPRENKMPDVPPGLLARAGCVFDAVYNPEQTLLLKTARSLGVKTAGGMDMLVWQAARAQSIWLGVEFDPEKVRETSRLASLEQKRMFGAAKG